MTTRLDEFRDESGATRPWCRRSKQRGYPVAARIQITSLQDGARGIADAKLTIDDSVWRELSEMPADGAAGPRVDAPRWWSRRRPSMARWWRRMTWGGRS